MAGLHSLTEMQGGRYRELQEREKELRREMEALEAEAQELDKAASRLAAEEEALAERRRQLDARERELDALALALEPALQAVEDALQSGTAPVSSLEHVLDARQDLSPVLEQERARIRAEIEREMADQLSRIAQLEEELQATLAVSRAPAPPRRPVADVDVTEMVRLLSDQVGRQLGAGMEGSVDRGAVRTNIERLDQILAGGIPDGSVILLNGPAGSMKTSLAYHVLHTAARDGIGGMYFSLEQDSAALLRQMKRLGMPREESLDNLAVVDMVDLRRSTEGRAGDWRQVLVNYVSRAVEQRPFRLFVLDSLEAFMAMSEHVFDRAELQDLFDRFRELGLTTIVVSETPMARLEKGEHTELYVADGAIELVVKEAGDARPQRWLRCVKMRGANIDTRYHALLYQDGAFSLSLPMSRGSGPSSG